MEWQNIYRQRIWKRIRIPKNKSPISSSMPKPVVAQQPVPSIPINSKKNELIPIVLIKYNIVN